MNSETPARPPTAEPPVIGGELPVPLARLLPTGQVPPAPAGAVSVASGRTALRLLARAVPALRERGVLLPGYLCSSLVQALREEGVRIVFYPVRADLNPDAARFAALVENCRPGAVLFINYFGFPPAAEVLALLRQLRQQTLVIEDCVHGSWLESDAPPVGGVGDFVFTSFRKYLEVPDGGWLRSRRADLALPVLAPLADGFAERKLLGKLLRHEALAYGDPTRCLEAAYLDLFARSEAELDAESPLAGMSGFSAQTVAATDLGQVCRARRDNFGHLARAFAGRPRLSGRASPVFSELPDGVSPLAFPIRIQAGRDEVRQHLRRHRIYAPVHWRLPEEVWTEAFAESQRLSETLLSLPVDQRYGEAAMLRVAATLEEALDN